MNKKIFEIAGLKTSEIGKLNICWREAQKELLEEILEINKSNGIGWNETIEIITDKLESLENNLK